MLGEQIGEETGKVMVRRVISVDSGTKVEVTTQSAGELLGVETRNTVTYSAGIRPDGSPSTARRTAGRRQGWRAGDLQGRGSG